MTMNHREGHARTIQHHIEKRKRTTVMSTFQQIKKRSSLAHTVFRRTFSFSSFWFPPQKDCSHHNSLIMHDGSRFVVWLTLTNAREHIASSAPCTHAQFYSLFSQIRAKYPSRILCTHWRGQPDRKTLALRFKNGNNSTESKDVHITCSISITSKFPIHHHQQGNFWELEARVKHDMDSHDSTLTSCTRSKLPHVCPREFWHALLIRVDCNTLSSFISSIGVVYRCKPNSLGIHNAATVSF